jgi:hypothetical protein
MGSNHESQEPTHRIRLSNVLHWGKHLQSSQILDQLEKARAEHSILFTPPPSPQHMVFKSLENCSKAKVRVGLFKCAEKKM